MPTKISISCLLVLCGMTLAQERVAKIPETDFERLAKLVKPLPGESPWRDIAWLTDVTEARKKAAAEDKPIVIFTAADGSPLGRT